MTRIPGTPQHISPGRTLPRAGEPSIITKHSAILRQCPGTNPLEAVHGAEKYATGELHFSARRDGSGLRFGTRDRARRRGRPAGRAADHDVELRTLRRKREDV